MPHRNRGLSTTGGIVEILGTVPTCRSCSCHFGRWARHLRSSRGWAGGSWCGRPCGCPLSEWDPRTYCVTGTWNHTYVSTWNRPQAVRLMETIMSSDIWETERRKSVFLLRMPSDSPISMARCNIVYPQSSWPDKEYLVDYKHTIQGAHRPGLVRTYLSYSNRCACKDARRMSPPFSN